MPINEVNFEPKRNYVTVTEEEKREIDSIVGGIIQNIGVKETLSILRALKEQVSLTIYTGTDFFR